MNQITGEKLTIAADFSSSLFKGIYTFAEDRISPLLIFIEPQIVEVPFESIENYEKKKLGTGREEDTAWVKVGEIYYAVGFLARKRFHAVKSLNTLKIDAAIPLMLAMLGAIAQKHKLGNKFKVTMGILLPLSEHEDKERFEFAIDEAMKSFTFRGEEYSLELEKFAALPEGGGLIAKARAPKLNQSLQTLKEVNLVVLMMGYRNVSLLVLERGELVKGITSDLGMSKMINKVMQMTSGQTDERLIEVICSIESKKTSYKKSLEKLVRTTRPELVQAEIELINSSIANAREEYVMMVRNWLKQEIPKDNVFDEILIGGGTAKYLKEEIKETLRPYGAQLNWGEKLESRIKQTFGEQVKKDELVTRLVDVYGFFYKLLNAPIPSLHKGGEEKSLETLKETGENKDVRA